MGKSPKVTFKRVETWLLACVMRQVYTKWLEYGMKGFMDGWCSTMWDLQVCGEGESFEVWGRKWNNEVGGSDKDLAPSVAR